MKQTRSQNSLFFQNLDGLRFLAFFYVFLFHCQFLIPGGKKIPFFSNLFIFLSGNGNSGVEFFFVLSGFLITILLLKEEQDKGKIRLDYFYFRRILRIWPLYYLTLCIGFILYPFLSGLTGHPVRETASPPAYIFFLANFNILSAGPPHSGTLGVLWSVAVEEQFYLLWPLLLIVLKRLRPGLFIGLVIVSLIFRSLHADDAFLLTYHPLSLAGDFAIGGLLAWVCLPRLDPGSLDARHGKIAGFFLYSSLIILLLFKDRIFAITPLFILQRCCLDLFFAGIIFDQAYSRYPLFALGKSGFLTKWGKYTYGLYCLHIPALSLVLLLFMRSAPEGGFSRLAAIVVPVVGFVLTLILASLSFIYFESPFLALKAKFSMANPKGTGEAAAKGKFRPSAVAAKKIPPENQGEQNN